MSNHLWYKPDHDPDFIMSERITKMPDLMNPDLDNDEIERLVEIHHSLCQIYYDVFNNDGCNLADVRWLREAIVVVSEYAESKNLDVPEFVTMLDDDDDCPCSGPQFETIDVDPMDEFARKVIRHLYLDLKPI